MNRPDPQLAAFRRLLTDAHAGGQAKVDALVALVQRTIFVAPWPAGVEGYRTLVNSEGNAALPIFSAKDELETAARRYGWLHPDGSAPLVEVGARAALNYARQQELSFVVIDIAGQHALEIASAEFEPLLTPAARRDSSGPFAGTGKLSSSLIRAVRPTPPPMAPATMRGTPPPGSLAAPRTPTSRTSQDIRPPANAPGMRGATETNMPPVSESGVAVGPPGSEPSEAVIDALTTVLRDYPEVEWACFVNALRAGSATPSIGVRIDAGFRQRVDEIVGLLGRTAQKQGATLGVLLLDDATLMRSARGEGIVFYPWRKR